MSVVLNERKWAEQMITQRSLGKKPFETITRVARYYLDNGVSKKEVRKMMDSFLIQCDPTASIPKWANIIDGAVNTASKYEAVSVDYIPVTSNELKRIKELQGKQLQRLAFTLLCLAKYWNIISKSKDNWVNSKDSEIMQLANINTSIKRQSAMYHTLNDCGMVRFSRKVDNTNVQVCFIEDGDVELKITDFRNLGYQYLKYLGEPYFECANCGIVTKYNDPKNKRKQKYCKTCAAEIAIQQRVESVMRAHYQKTS